MTTIIVCCLVLLMAAPPAHQLTASYVTTDLTSTRRSLPPRRCLRVDSCTRSRVVPADRSWLGTGQVRSAGAPAGAEAAAGHGLYQLPAPWGPGCFRPRPAVGPERGDPGMEGGKPELDFRGAGAPRQDGTIARVGLNDGDHSGNET